MGVAVKKCVLEVQNESCLLKKASRRVENVYWGERRVLGVCGGDVTHKGPGAVCYFHVRVKRIGATYPVWPRTVAIHCVWLSSMVPTTQQVDAADTE
jgi:hypothetical protein